MMVGGLNKIINITILSLCLVTLINAQIPLEIDLKEASIEEAPINIFIGVLPSVKEMKQEFSTHIKRSLDRTSQIKSVIRFSNKPKSKKSVKKLFEDGFDWVVFIERSSEPEYIDIRIYDPIEAIMVTGKKFKITKSIKFLSYKISDFIWSELMDEESCFCSKIAFIKRKKDDSGKNYSEIWSCDFDGTNMKKIISDFNIYAGLSWYNSKNYPCLLGSQITKFNMKLICFNSNKLKRSLLDVPGTCIGVSLSPISKEAIYCRSGNIWKYERDPKYKKSIHKKIIYNDGNNTTPTLLKNGDIVFCSDSKTLFTESSINKKIKWNRGPKVYYYNFNDSKVELITLEGSCENPAYSETNNQIAYSKRIAGEMQLFIYDINTKTHKQLTFDSGSKVDCNWSPCGSYIIFCHRTDVCNKLSIIHVKLNKNWSITGSDEECVYPAWSINLLSNVF